MCGPVVIHGLTPEATYVPPPVGAQARRACLCGRMTRTWTRRTSKNQGAPVCSRAFTRLRAQDTMPNTNDRQLQVSNAALGRNQIRSRLRLPPGNPSGTLSALDCRPGTPTGFRPIAQGCGARAATLGSRPSHINPNGVASISLSPREPPRTFDTPTPYAASCYGLVFSTILFFVALSEE